MKRIVLILSALTFLFAACEKEEAENIMNEAEYFPNTVNSYWKYERVDSLDNTTDTVTVTITGDTLVSNDSYKIWEYDYGSRVETMYVLQSNDSIIFYRSHFDWIDCLYITPFELGLEWKNPSFQPDSSFVSSVEDVAIDGRLYQDVVLIERNAQGFNSFLAEKIWIKPGVGVVKLEREQYVFGSYVYEFWKLIESHTP